MYKKIFPLIALVLLLSLAACSSQAPPAAPAPAKPAESAPVQKEVPAPAAPEVKAPAAEEVSSPEVNDVGQQIAGIDQADSELDTSEVSDVDSALGDIENI